MNKDQWVSHFACTATGFNLVFTHPSKSDATRIVQKALNIVETRYNGKIVFFRSDMERKLLGLNLTILFPEKVLPTSLLHLTRQLKMAIPNGQGGY